MILKNKTSEILPRIFGAKFFLLIIVVILTSITACDKESSVGLGVQPPNDLLHVGFQDTTRIVTKTVKEDSLRTDQGLISNGYYIVGKYIDPIFGEADASIYTQLKLISDAPTFGINPICDSVVLSLKYYGTYYGETSGRRPAKQTISVYQLNDQISTAVPFYSDSVVPGSAVPIPYLANDLANHKTFVPDLTDSVSAEGTLLHPHNKLAPQLRVQLQKEFGQVILNRQGNIELNDNSTFTPFMKGLYITAKNTTGLNPGEGRINSFIMQASYVKIYYHNTSPTLDTLSLTLALWDVARFMTYNHDYTGASAYLNQQLNDHTDTALYPHYTSTYIQSMAGVKTKIEFPNLLNFAKPHPVAINKAELVVNVDPATIAYNGNNFNPPDNLLLFGINDDKTLFLLPDLTEIPYYYNGAYDATTHQYRLNISRYIQQVLTGKLHNNGLYLTLPHISGAITANRVVIGGGVPGTTNQMKLEITYTKLH
jgi:hypothetical protein